MALQGDRMLADRNLDLIADLLASAMPVGDEPPENPLTEVVTQRLHVLSLTLARAFSALEVTHRQQFRLTGTLTASAVSPLTIDCCLLAN